MKSNHFACCVLLSFDVFESVNCMDGPIIKSDSYLHFHEPCHKYVKSLHIWIWFNWA